MKDKVKEVQDYFIDKMIAKQYDVIKTEDCRIKIIINDKYSFWLWAYNSYDTVSIFLIEENFMYLEFTDEQKKILFDNFREDIKLGEEAKKQLEIKELEDKLIELKKSK